MLRREEAEAFERPVCEWLRVSVESVLKHKQAGAVFCAKHKRVQPSSGHAASILTANINEVRAFGVGPVDIVDPVALLVGASILEIKMINHVVKSTLNKVCDVDSWEGKCCGSEECECERFHF